MRIQNNEISMFEYIRSNFEMYIEGLNVYNLDKNREVTDFDYSIDRNAESDTITVSVSFEEGGFNFKIPLNTINYAVHILEDTQKKLEEEREEEVENNHGI